VLAASVVGVSGGLAGCASGEPASAGVGRPQDFGLAVTVYRGERVPLDAPLAERDARFILEADGVLRAEFGRRARERSFPPVVRRLRPEEVTDLWRLVYDAEVFRGAGRLAGPETFDPGSESVVLIEATGKGRRRTVVRPSDGAAERALVSKLGELVWVRGVVGG